MPSELSSRVTGGIRVNVRTAYIRDESSPKHQHYVFAYQIEIVNESSEAIQLLTREWHITDGHGFKRIVEGEGVIGKQPLIKPGDTYRYVSGSHFRTPIGRMNGYYYVVKSTDKTMMKVEIPAFTMLVPYLNN